MNKFYKIVKVIEDRLMSQFIDIPEAMVEYKVGEWVYPKIPNSRLIVFDDLKYIRRYILTESLIFKVSLDIETKYRLIEGYKIFECKVEDPIRIDRLSFGNYSWMAKFWENGQQSMINAPIGTIGAKSVKLLEEIQL